MTKRSITSGGMAVFALVLVFAAARNAQSSGQAGSLVRLQSTTPGTAQTGHANLSGTIRAGQLVGGGVGVTNVNAAQLGGLASSAFGQLAGANTWTAINTFSNASNSFTGIGTGLTALNAANLGSGTVPGARLGGTYGNALTLSNASNAFTGNGAGLTNVNAAQLGGLASSAFAQLGGTNTWTGANTFSNAGNSFTGVGTGLTALNASNLTSGNIPGARLGGIYANAVSFTNINNTFVGSASGLVDLNALNMTSGTLLNGRLSGTYTNALTFNNAGNAFTGNGANLTGVNATTLDGIDSTAFLQSVPVPLSLSGDNPTEVLSVTNSSTSPEAHALSVDMIAAADNAAAILARTTSSSTIAYGMYSFMNGPGIGTWSYSTGGIGLFAQGMGTAPALVAENGGGGLALQARNNSEFQGNVSIGAGSSPVFPLDFPETLGNKISLWGTSPTSHYGFGIQGGQMQIFTATGSDAVSFGYGGSTAFSESVRIINSTVDLRFRPGGGPNASQMSTPYDFLIDHDFDNNSADSWIRFFTNNFFIEQVRIQDGDEAATLFDGAVTANGIDFAEAFKVHDQTLEPGDLVVNYGQDWEYIAKSEKAYDQAVIGVVSTKPSFIAGMSFDAEDNMDRELTRHRDAARKSGDKELEKMLTKQMGEMVKRAYRPVAFMGRVPVKVTGVVRQGDHLGSSNIPGVAQSMTRSGQSIGIALESSAGNKDKIMVMIQPRYFSAAAAVDIDRNASAVSSELKSRLIRVEAENADLRARLDRLEQLLKNR